MKNFEPKSLIKWVPVVLAAVVAAVQAAGEKAEQERIDNMDERLKKLEEEES